MGFYVSWEEGEEEGSESEAEVSDEVLLNLLQGSHLCQVATLSELAVTCTTCSHLRVR